MNKFIIRVLIVENDPADATLIASILDVSDILRYEVRIVYRLDGATPLFETGPADVCLVALHAQQGRGFELLQQTRDLVGDIPVIALTSGNEAELTHKSVDFGAQDYLDKDTLSADVLNRSIHYCLQRHLLQSELAATRQRGEELRFQHLLDSSADALVIVNKRGDIVRANEQAEALFGYGHNELLGRNAEILIPDRCRDNYVASRTRYMADPVFKPMGTTNEQLGLRKDGVEVPVEISLRPIETEPELLIAAAVRDISVRNAIERQLQRFRAALDISSDGIFLIDRSTMKFLHANEAACLTFGYSFEELLCMGPHDIAPELTKEHLDQRYDRRIDGHRTVVVQTVHLDKNGAELLVEVAVRLLEFGEQQLLIVVARDITARLQVEAALKAKDEQLRQLQRHEAVGALAGGVAHKFNNLLQAIRGYTCLVMDSLPKDDQRSRDLEQVMQATGRAASLTSQLLDYSRRKSMKPVPLDISAAVVEAIKILRPLLNGKIELRSTIGYDVGMVRADPALIQQVIINLCVNARDAMPNGGQLSIRTESVELSEAFCETNTDCSPGTHGLLTVSDTGEGLSSLAQSRIFEPFFATKEMNKGSGLGLTIVHEIVRQHGGAIRVSSEPGRGTTFKIYLPTIDQSIGTGSGDEPQSLARGTEAILLVEDENLVRDIAVRILTDAGYKVIAAADGATAIRLFHENVDDISLTVLDVVMPKMGGREVYEQIKQFKPGLPVLFSTGYDRESLQSKLDDDHHDTETEMILIEKPYTPQSLLQKVRVILDRSRSNSGLQLTC